MFLKNLYFYLIVANLGVLYYAPAMSGHYPFLVIFITYLLTISLLLVKQILKNSKTNSLENLAKVMTSNAHDLFFIAGLAILDLLIFLLFVPDTAIKALQELRVSVIFFGLMILLFPMLVMKFRLETPAKLFENLFWESYKSKITQGHKPSPEFATFIISRIHHQNTKQERKLDISPIKNTSLEDNDVVLTAYPVDNKHAKDDVKVKKNPLFDSEETMTPDDPYKAYTTELLELYPELESYTKQKSVNLRPEFLLNILISNIPKDLNLYQVFQNKKF